MIIKRLLIASVLLLGTLVVLLFYLPGMRENPATPSAVSGVPSIGGPFTLTDQHGNTVTEATLKGRYSLVFFGFTHCPDICPLTLQNVTQAIELAGPSGDNVTPVFISVDPERDTVETMAAYVAPFHPRFLALTGTPEQVRGAAASYKVFASKAPVRDAAGKATDDYTMQHSGNIFLMDTEGRYLAHFAHDTPALQIAARIRRAAAQ